MGPQAGIYNAGMRNGKCGVTPPTIPGCSHGWEYWSGKKVKGIEEGWRSDSALELRCMGNVYYCIE